MTGNEKNRKLLAPRVPKELIEYIKKFLVSIILGLLALTSYASNTVSVRDIQLLLALEGYDLDAKGIDGKLGQVTKKSIEDYRKKKNLPAIINDNELIDEELYNSLYEDTKSKETLKKCRTVIDLTKYAYLPPSEPTNETDNLCRS